MYINKTDYTGRISMSLLDILIAENAGQIIADTGKECEDIIRTFCGVLYKIDDELVKTGSDRNGYIMSLAKSIGLYFIYQRADDADIPEKIIKNYDDAMDDLEKISTGKKVLALPPLDEPDNGGGGEDVPTGGTGLRRMGSQDKRSHQV